MSECRMCVALAHYAMFAKSSNGEAMPTKCPACGKETDGKMTLSEVIEKMIERYDDVFGFHKLVISGFERTRDLLNDHGARLEALECRETSAKYITEETAKAIDVGLNQHLKCLDELKANVRINWKACSTAGQAQLERIEKLERFERSKIHGVLERGRIEGRREALTEAAKWLDCNYNEGLGDEIRKLQDK